MLKIAIMQPYFAPYIGYFELMAAADLFVVLDDVQFPRRGWVNRNRFRSDRSGRSWSYLSLPVAKMDRSAKICDVNFRFNSKWGHDFYQRVGLNYGAGACEHPLVRQILGWAEAGERGVAQGLASQLLSYRDTFNLKTKIVRANEEEIGMGLTGQSRIIEICRTLKATDYLNLPGGRILYDPDAFREHDVTLRFMAPTEYSCWASCGVRLSVLDGILSGELDRMRAHLHGFEG